MQHFIVGVLLEHALHESVADVDVVGDGGFLEAFGGFLGQDRSGVGFCEHVSAVHAVADVVDEDAVVGKNVLG